MATLLNLNSLVETYWINREYWISGMGKVEEWRFMRKILLLLKRRKKWKRKCEKNVHNILVINMNQTILFSFFAFFDWKSSWWNVIIWEEKKKWVIKMSSCNVGANIEMEWCLTRKEQLLLWFVFLIMYAHITLWLATIYVCCFNQC